MKTGIQLITAERKRQTEKEGWTAEHDDEHNNFEMAKVAICYAASSAEIDVVEKVEYESPAGIMYRDLYPWDCCDDKREKHDELKKLVIAGALIAAEIDRLIRLG